MEFNPTTDACIKLLDWWMREGKHKEALQLSGVRMVHHPILFAFYFCSLRRCVQVFSSKMSIRPIAACSAYHAKMTEEQIDWFSVLGTVHQLREVDLTMYQVRL